MNQQNIPKQECTNQASIMNSKKKERKNEQNDDKINEVKMIKYTKNQKRVFFEPELGEAQVKVYKILSQNRIKLILSLLLARFFMYLPFSFLNKEYPIIEGSKINSFVQILPKYLLVTETSQCITVSIFCGVFMDLYSMFSISQLSMVISIIGIAIQGMSITSQSIEIFMIGYSLSFFVKLAYLVCFEKIIFDSAVSFRQASVNSSLLNIIACLARIISCLVSYYYNQINTVQYITLAFCSLGILSHIIPLRVLLNTYGLIEKEKMIDQKYCNFTKYKNYKLSPKQIKKIYWQKDYLYLVLMSVVLLFVTSFKSSTYIRHIIPNQSEDLCLMYTCFPSKNLSDLSDITFIEYFLDALHQVGGLLFCTPIVYVISSKKNSIQLRYKSIFIASIVILITCIFQVAVYTFRNGNYYYWNITVISIISIIFGACYYLIRTLLIQLHFAINHSNSSIRGIGIAIIATFTELQTSLFSLYPYKEDTILGLFYLCTFTMAYIVLYQYNYLKGKQFTKVEKVITRKFRAVKT